MKYAISYAAMVVAFIGGISVASAEPQDNDQPSTNQFGEFCAPAEGLIARANKIFHEQVRWTGKDVDGYRYVLMVSPNSWTFVMIDNKPGKDGAFEACVKASDGATPSDHQKDAPL